MSQPSTPSPLILRVEVFKGENLAAKDKCGTSDPYLVIKLDEARHQTSCIPKTLNPEWNETVDLPISEATSLKLEVVCWDKDRFGKDYMGQFEISLEDLFINNSSSAESINQPAWYDLHTRRGGKKQPYVSGRIKMGHSLVDPLNPSSTKTQCVQSLIRMVTRQSSDLVGSDGDGDDEVSDEDEDSLSGDEATLVRNGDTGHKEESAEPEAVKKKRLPITRLARKEKKRAYQLSNNTEHIEGVLFFEVSKITDLPPAPNATRTSFDMDPFVVVSLGKSTYRTKVIHHNLNPVYDEKLVFQVRRHETSYSMKFSIMDRDSLSGNDLVGTASLPLEQIIALASEPDPHTGLFNLSDPPESASPSASSISSGAPTDSKKPRFRLPIGRTPPGLSRMSKPANGGSQAAGITGESQGQASSGGRIAAPAASDNQPSSTNYGNILETHTFQLKVDLVKKEWANQYNTVQHVKAKYMPYQVLRQQFWRAMLKNYAAEDSEHINKLELMTLLDCLGSTLDESTVDECLKKRGKLTSDGDLILMMDDAVMCLEDLISKPRSLARSSSTSSSEDTSDHQGQETGEDKAPGVNDKDDDDNQTVDLGVEGPVSGLRAPPSLSGAGEFSGPEITTAKNGVPGERGQNGETRSGASLESQDPGSVREEDGGEQVEQHVIEIRECPICHQPRLGKESDSDIIIHIATCASQDWRQVDHIMMGGFVTSSQARRKWCSRAMVKFRAGVYQIGANSGNILVQDRVTGLIEEEKMSTYVRVGIRLLYMGLKSRELEKKRIRKLLKSLSYKQGKKYDDPASAAEIPGFISFHGLDMSEVLVPVDQFKTFNQFFYRELVPGARACCAPDRPEIVTSLADCRAMVFPRIEDAMRLWIKGRGFSLDRLFGSAYPEEAGRYLNGALMISRLAPQDYHRFHIPVDGILGEPRMIEGEYYTVNPMAIRSALDVYGENVRALIPIDSDVHGRVMVVCVGAMMVGSIVITREEGQRVERGEELGYFKFGGSTILILFEPGMVMWDDDLLTTSSGGLESLIRAGTSVGHSPGRPPFKMEKQKSHKGGPDPEPGSDRSPTLGRSEGGGSEAI